MTRATSRDASGISKPPSDPYRLLLDQNFPKPDHFDLASVDGNTEAVHLWDFDATLSEPDTPDWFIYAKAAASGFDAVVTRDASQVTLREELWVLSRLHLTLITWRKAIEDPIAEWGQLVAYLPKIRARGPGRSSQVIFLPKPTIGRENCKPVRDLFGSMAKDRSCSRQELSHEAQVEVRGYLVGHDPGQTVAQQLRLRGSPPTGK